MISEWSLAPRIVSRSKTDLRLMPPATPTSDFRLGLLIVCMLFPAGMMAVVFHAAPGSILANVIYSTGKGILLLIPLWWIWKLDRQPIRIPRPNRCAVIDGLISGSAMSFVILVAYFGFLRSTDMLAAMPDLIHLKLQDFHLDSPIRFLGFAVFVMIANASLEEYYWRGFIFKRLQCWISCKTAALLSGAVFSLHHIVILNAYIPSQYFWQGTLLFSAGVAVGGIVWAWRYHRTGSVYAAWFSHAVVDAAIYIIGYDMLWTGRVL